MAPWITIVVIVGGLMLWVAYDLLQRKHAILHNFPIIGHFRYWLEGIGPELRQYIVTSNDEERPFSRDERSWVYASSKKENNYFGFGTDNDMESSPNYLILKHSPFPVRNPTPHDDDYDPDFRLPCAKILGGHRGRAKSFRPRSIVNVSAMSFGSLSGPAIHAINAGCAIADCLHNTGEGGVASHHLKGGELIFQLGTAYFGCRDEKGRFNESAYVELLERHPIRAVELKLSQGAKPGKGGLLPAAKITDEIAAIRGIPKGRDCVSPAAHREFRDVDSLLDFVERLADLGGGIPVGIKSAVGQMEFWGELADQMQRTGRGVDFITVDGGEGGTGAAPLAFSDHVAFPFRIGFSRVYKQMAARDMHEKVVFVGSGKLGFPETALMAVALGCDLIGVAREAMLAIGCIQAQRCHTGHCPTGVATQNRWLVAGLDPTHKSARLANYVVNLRKEMLDLTRACGVEHPALLTPDRFEIIDERFGSKTLDETFGYQPEWGKPSDEDARRIVQLMRDQS